ncbi:MAG: oxaloacetate decarboxylase gamma chain [Gammaproteobacteria bacterium]|nr:MAG: oxaloacetate decarboxylase gamma chain [Gammaproteobacteria bacterium]
MFEAEAVLQGLELALLGMGTVFAFLTVLVLGTSTMSWIVQRFDVEDARPTVTRPGRPGEEDAEVVAAITAAVRIHRSRR